MNKTIGALTGGLALSLALSSCKPGAETPPSTTAATPPPATSPAASSPSTPPAPTTASTGSAPMDSGFRAIGQEPGWMAQVSAGARPSLHAEVDYGERKFDIAPANLLADGWSGKASDGTAIVMKIERRTCQDPMSGQKFEVAATLTVGDRSYEGCGNFNPR